MVHGDDFIGVGERPHIQHFRKQLAHRFTVKDQIVGNRKDLKEENEARILNRVVRITSTGWEYEADQRHPDLLVKELGLTKAKATKTPWGGGANLENGGERERYRQEFAHKVQGLGCAYQLSGCGQIRDPARG